MTVAVAVIRREYGREFPFLPQQFLLLFDVIFLYRFGHVIHGFSLGSKCRIGHALLLFIRPQQFVA